MARNPFTAPSQRQGVLTLSRSGFSGHMPMRFKEGEEGQPPAGTGEPTPPGTGEPPKPGEKPQIPDHIAAELRTLRKFKEDSEKAEDDRKKANLSEVERERTEKTEALKTADKLKRDNLVLEVALDLSVPKELRHRLQGGTREELEADAKSLMELVNKGKGQEPGNTGTPGGSPPPSQSETQKKKADLEAQFKDAEKKGNTRLMLNLQRQIEALPAK